MSTPSLIIIAGPNASGKSELAVKLAKKFNGEIVSADSRQIYKGLDIGSGKVPGKWRTILKKSDSNICSTSEVQQGWLGWASNRPAGKAFLYKKIAHHCIDFVSPKKRYTVAEYQKCAAAAVADIHARGKVPFLVGGTGFYIKAVVDATPFPAVPPQEKLRKKLEKQSTAQLAALLKKKDLRRWSEIDRKNRRRLIRALEIIAATKKPIPKAKPRALYRTLFLGLTPSRDELRKKIAQRLKKRLKKGMIAEVQRLHAKGITWKRLGELGLEYRHVAEYLRKKLTRKELEEKLQTEIWHYARRQMTWFKKEKRIRWICSAKEAERMILKFKQATR